MRVLFFYNIEEMHIIELVYIEGMHVLQYNMSIQMEIIMYFKERLNYKIMKRGSGYGKRPV